ncbi:MAG: hypothetical protein OEW37_04700 [Rhodospirillaceae bacterium]|nr:hypothetical protein [Rhodospirillaceae bacterium]
MRIALTDIFKFNIAEIDNGHERIVVMLNEIGDSLNDKNIDAALRQVIHLIAVERKHVFYENNLLEKNNYTTTGINTHTDYHSKLNTVLNEIMLALGDQDFALATDLHKMLCTVFLDDILNADLPFKSLLQHKILKI